MLNLWSPVPGHWGQQNKSLQSDNTNADHDIGTFGMLNLWSHVPGHWGQQNKSLQSDDLAKAMRQLFLFLNFNFFGCGGKVMEINIQDATH
jgi:hypothetical protein